MKKVLFLTLILCLAGMASAGSMTFSALDDDTAQVSGSGYVIVDQLPEFAGIYVIVVGGVPDLVMEYTGNLVTVSWITDEVKGDAATLLGISESSITKVIGIEYADTTPSPNTVLPNGLLTTFNGTYSPATIYVLDSSSGDELVGSPITILPEPMTIALLGLGGLFIRKRRS